MIAALHVWGPLIGEALASLRDNRLRTGLSILGIAIGIAAVMAVGTVSKGGRHLIFSELETFGLRSVWVWRDFEEKDPRRAVREGTGIDESDYQAIRDGCCPAVVKVSPMLGRFKGKGGRILIRFGSRYSNARIEGVGHQYTAINNDAIVAGRPLREEDDSKRRSVVLIGNQVQADLFGAQSAVGKEIRIASDKFVVVGVLKHKSRGFLASIGSSGGIDANNVILMPYTRFQRLAGARDEIEILQAEAASIDDADAAVAQISELLQRRHAQRYRYKGETMSKYIATASNITDGVTVIGVIAASISLLVGGMAIMNIMSTSVLERTREIGLRKALGARRGDIQFQFLVEAVLISGIGGLLGLIIGTIASYVLAWSTGFPLAPSLAMIALAVLVSVSVGLISGYYPARRAADLKPVEALRYE